MVGVCVCWCRVLDLRCGLTVEWTAAWCCVRGLSFGDEALRRRAIGLVWRVDWDCSGVEPIGRLGPLGCVGRPTCTRGLSTCWSGTALMGRSGLEGGFPLRCLQRLSRPRLATRRRHWRDDRCTRGASVPVLSYWGRRLADLLRPRQIGTELSHDVLNPARVPL